MIRVGLISDTHGLLRPEALAFLRGSDHIVHGGDIGDPQILETLRTIAPLTVVRGNNDYSEWARGIHETELVEIGKVHLYAIHNLAELDIDPAAAGIKVVVSGHTHKPQVNQLKGVIYVNPGSAGPRRFKLPIAVGELRIEGDVVTARTVDLEDAEP
ncbi:metallophosphoesterase family protein [soil metagenome]